MISNIIRVIIAAFLFTLLGTFFRIDYVSTSEIEYAKENLGIKDNAEIYILENNISSVNTTYTPDLSSASKINFFYRPSELEPSIKSVTDQMSRIVFSEIFSTKLTKLDIILHRESIDVRGKMKAGAVWLYEVEQLENNELMGVFIHEIAHHIDIYTLAKKVFRDPSSDFYDISWENTTTLKPGQKIKDFSSGYGMTNKYEDFAESMTYYVFANEEMREKAKNSFSMKQKYEFFEKNLFKNNEFKNTNFSLHDKKRYYWDMTKKGMDIQKFLQYLEKQI